MSDTDIRLGALLMKKKMINYQQLTQALEFQAKLISSNRMPLGEVLIQFGFINRNTLVETLKEQEKLKKDDDLQNQINSETESPFSKSQGFVVKPSFNLMNKANTPPPPPPPPPAQVDVSPASKTGPRISDNMYSDRSRHRPIGEILVEKEFINRAQLTHALQYQSVLPPIHYKPIGEVLIDLKYITREQLNTVLGIQPPVNTNALGEILKQLGMIDASQLSIVLMQQYSVGGKPVLIGELLIQHGFITKEQLNLALEEQKKRNS